MFQNTFTSTSLIKCTFSISSWHDVQKTWCIIFTLSFTKKDKFLTIAFLQHLRLAQKHNWGLQSSGIWSCITVLVVPPFPLKCDKIHSDTASYPRRMETWLVFLLSSCLLVYPDGIFDHIYKLLLLLHARNECTVVR